MLIIASYIEYQFVYCSKVMLPTSSDGFRRRTGISIPLDSRKSFHDDVALITDGLELRSQPGNFKFKKIPENKREGAA